MPAAPAARAPPLSAGASAAQSYDYHDGSSDGARRACHSADRRDDRRRRRHQPYDRGRDKLAGDHRDAFDLGVARSNDIHWADERRHIGIDSLTRNNDIDDDERRRIVINGVARSSIQYSAVLAAVPAAGGSGDGTVYRRHQSFLRALNGHIVRARASKAAAETPRTVPKPRINRISVREYWEVKVSTLPGQSWSQCITLGKSIFIFFVINAIKAV
jgi:hypothetical protein